MKVYTKTGDNGTTALYDGNRTSKTSIFFDVLGENDELSSRIGLLIAYLTEIPITMNDDEKTRKSNKLCSLTSTMRKIQVNLQDFASFIATPQKKNRRLPEIKNEIVEHLESQIDSMELDLPRLTKFILPGVTVVDAQAQLCRTQARKVERKYLYYNECEEKINTTNRNNQAIDMGEIKIPEFIMKYMNRLSDFFFVFSRWLCYFNEKSDFTKDMIVSDN